MADAGVRRFGTLLVSAAWSAASAAARELALAGVLPRERLDCRVVSVGNLQAGGAGKTPLVAEIARQGAARGKTVCILSRGYRGEWERSGGVLAPGAQAASAREAGDEPALLHELAPAAWIGVGADRAAQFRRIRERARPDLVVLDDGLQHWRLHRDLEIVALTSAGRGERAFRDGPGALSRADLLVWTKGEERPAHADKPLVRVRFRLRPVSGSPAIVLVTGVADARGVAESARAAGYRIVRHVEGPDHARYDATGARKLLDEAGRAGARVALTGKDWVKWRELGFAASELEILEPTLEFLEGEELWNRALWPEVPKGIRR
jgi:tetraacyldisaccharide 4'-kinase